MSHLRALPQKQETWYVLGKIEFLYKEHTFRFDLVLQSSYTQFTLWDMTICVWDLKGCGMGPRLVLVFPCFRENVVATCKIGSFLCCLGNLLQKNVIVLGKSILQVPDTGTRVLDNTRPFLHSSIVSFWITPAHSKERKYHTFRQYWYTRNVPVFTNTGMFQYLGPEVYLFLVLVFGNQISKWCSFEKGAIFDLLFTFSSHQGKVTKIPSAHISNTYIHIFCSPCLLFLPYQFWKRYKFIRYGFSLVWVLVLVFIRAILEQSINNKMVSKI